MLAGVGEKSGTNVMLSAGKCAAGEKLTVG
jgi:hypothetical protein